ncbi:MAG: hypothetical protein J3Q66DRAFT_401971 [Benniella sp.]|nr:MAG: hypothetical protein J3Q66DRAFT_401971 [Benniella sp.]
MPLLSLSNPRNRVTLIAALLVMEFMAILWLRESRPNINSHQASSVLPEPSHNRYHVQDDLQYRQLQQHQGQARREDRYEKTDPRSSSKELDQAGLGTKDGAGSDMVGRDNTSSAERTPPLRQRQQQQHAYHSPPQQTAIEPEQMIVAAAIVPSSSGTESAKTLPSPPKASSKVANTIKRLGKKISIKKPKAFKSRKPATKSTVDETGHLIEDHFISPRDTGGDGVPDFFVLLRPTANSKYMMDVGLFEDEIAVPVPAVLSSVVASAPATGVPSSVTTPDDVPTLATVSPPSSSPIATAPTMDSVQRRRV